MPPKEKTPQQQIVESLSESQSGNLSIFSKFRNRYQEDVMAARVMGQSAQITDVSGGAFSAAHNMMVAITKTGGAVLMTEAEFATMYARAPEPESKPKKPKEPRSRSGAQGFNIPPKPAKPEKPDSGE